MTNELMKKINRLLAVLSITCGGLGMVMCVPYLLLENLAIVGATAIVFLGGAVLYTGGLVSLAILAKEDK